MYTSIKDAPKRLVFHHVPKTAGTSLFRLLEKKVGSASICPLRFGNVRLAPPEYTDRFKIIFAHLKYDADNLFNEALRATFLRDPFDRFMSSYFFYRQINVPDIETILLSEIDINCIYKYEKYAILLKYIGNKYVDYFSDKIETDKKVNMTISDNDIYSAIKNLNNIHVGFVEDFDKSTSDLFLELKFPYVEGDSTVENTTSRSGLLSEFNSESYEFIKEFLAPDYVIYFESLRKYFNKHEGFTYKMLAYNRPIYAIGEVQYIRSSEKNSGGVIAFGPYIKIPIGIYVAKFNLIYASAVGVGKGNIANIKFEVFDSSKSEAVGEKYITIEPGSEINDMNIEIDFQITWFSNGVEFRVLDDRDTLCIVDVNVKVVRSTDHIGRWSP